MAQLINPSTTSPQGAGAILSLIREGPRTRSELVDLTGMARSTVSQRLRTLLDQELLVQVEEGISNGGRPPSAFAFNEDSGLILAADLGATHARVAVTNLGGQILELLAEDVSIGRPPEVAMDWLAEKFDELLLKTGRPVSDVRGIGVGIPAPVEFAVGRAVHPPMMPGWEDYPIAGQLSERYHVPVLVDNDVNIMAIGEYSSAWNDVQQLLFVKVSTGIGCGIVINGHVHRGAQGAAGDIGHIRVPGHDDVLCRCGNTGCIEAVAGGGALAAATLRTRARDA